MAIDQFDILPHVAAAHRELVFPIGALAAGNTTIASRLLGYRFQVVAVRVFGSAFTTVTNVDVRIGGTTALASAVVPSAGTEVAGTLATALASKRGSRTQALTVVVAATGTPSAQNAWVSVVVRPYPMNGEAAVGA